MKEYAVSVNGVLWTIKASNKTSAVGKGMRAYFSQANISEEARRHRKRDKVDDTRINISIRRIK